MSRFPRSPSLAARSFIDSPRLNSFRGSRRGGERIVIREGMKRCEQQCPSRLVSVRAHLPLPPTHPPLSFFSRRLHPARARRIGPRPNDRTANIWQLRNMSLHLIIAVNTGGRVEWPQGVSPTRYGRCRARPLGVNSDLPSSSPLPPPPRHPPPPPSLSLSCPLALLHQTIRIIVIIIVVHNFVAPYWPPANGESFLLPSGTRTILSQQRDLASRLFLSCTLSCNISSPKPTG